MKWQRLRTFVELHAVIRMKANRREVRKFIRMADGMIYSNDVACGMNPPLPTKVGHPDKRKADASAEGRGLVMTHSKASGGSDKRSSPGPTFKLRRWGTRKKQKEDDDRAGRMPALRKTNDGLRHEPTLTNEGWGTRIS